MGAQALALGGLARNKWADGLMNHALIHNAYIESAVDSTNIDNQTGQNFGDLEPDTLGGKVYYGALEALPDLLLTFGSAFIAGPAAAVGKVAGKVTGKKVAKEGLEKAITTRSKQALLDATGKRRAGVFAGVAGVQTYSKQLSESVNYYINEKGMDPFEAGGLIVSESLMAGLSTAITSRVSADFLFINKPQQYLARSMWGNVARNYMIGAVSEGMQEASEQVLTDAALMSIAAIRGDEEKMARVGFLREGYLYDLAVAGLTGAALGGPMGVIGRAGRSAIRPGFLDPRTRPVVTRGNRNIP